MPRQNLDTSEDAKKKYSAAYFMGRELLLEPQNGCAEEALLRREAARSASEGPARGRARAYARAFAVVANR